VRLVIATSPLLTRREAAVSLRQSVRKVDDLIASEQLAAVRIGRSVRIRQAAIDSFIKERESGGKINREGGA